ncbi:MULTISPECIES: CxxxxCH/CxxCH domain-containing protein [Kribbella]
MTQTAKCSNNSCHSPGTTPGPATGRTTWTLSSTTRRWWW